MTVYPLILRLGPIELTGYGLMMMVAFLMAGWAIQLDLRRRKLDEEFAADIVIAGVVGGLVGAKIWYVLLTGEWDALLRRGGFVWYGGFLGATAAILLNAWRRRVPWRFTAEICAAPLAAPPFAPSSARRWFSCSRPRPGPRRSPSWRRATEIGRASCRERV